MSALLPVVPCSTAPSPRLVRTLGGFGLLVRRADTSPEPDAAALGALLALPARALALVVGPSGCGKTLLLGALGAAARERGVRVIWSRPLPGRPSERPILDLVAGPRPERLLSLAGLGEARLWARRPRELSDGQRARLAIALAMARVRPEEKSLVLLDEFCSALDRPAAAGVARALRAWTRGAGDVRVVCATAHDDLAEPLRPDLIVRPEETP